MDKVLGLAAVYSSVRIISDMIASLPVNVYRYDADGVPVKLPGSQLLDDPSVYGTFYDWIFQGTSSALLWGNAMGLITSRTGVPGGPAGLGLPATIEWLPMDRVNIQDDEPAPYNPMRTKFFFDGHELQREEIVHLRAFTIPGRTEAISPLRAFATLIGQGLGALEYSNEWYHNGGFPPGTFQNTAEEVDRSQAVEIRQRLTDTLRLHQPLVYGRDWEYKAISIPPQEAAFVESMQLNATQVAAIYGLPPERVGGKRGDSLTYSTEQQEVLAIITDTLRPWLARWEQLFTKLLPTTQFAKFDVDQLLKTDLKTRYEIFQLQRNVGLRTTDELRRMDDLPPLAGDAGADPIPLVVLERMSATTRAIPKSLLNQVVLEQELAAELLLKLQQEGVVAPPEPGVPPVKAGAEQYLGRQLTLSRSWDDFEKAVQAAAETGDPGDDAAALDEARNAAREYVFAACREGLMYVAARERHLAAITAARSAHELSGLMYEVRRTAEAALKAQQIITRAEAGPGDTPFGPAHHRATHGDRARAHQWITNAHQAGALDDNELSERTSVAANAKLKGALGDLVKDLPTEKSLAGELQTLADDPPNHANIRARPGQAVAGPQAVTLLREMQLKWDRELEPASLNGKAH